MLRARRADRPGGGTVRAGPGVLLGQALDTRTDLSALAEWHPDLAARFTVLRDNLDWADDLAGPAITMPTAMDGTVTDGRAEAASRDMERRRAAAAAFDEVIAEIRQLPDFHGFLRPPPVAELLAAAAEGPVVVVTVSRFGSYALILTVGGVLDPVPLAGLTPETVYDRVVAFLGALDDAWSPAIGGRAPAEQQLGETLGWLWDALLARCSTGWASTARPGTASHGRGCGGACPGCCRSCLCTPPATTARGRTPPRPP